MNLLSEITRCCLPLSSMNSKWNSYLFSQNTHNHQGVHRLRSLQHNLHCTAIAYKWIFAAVLFHCTTPCNFPYHLLFSSLSFFVCALHSIIFSHIFSYFTGALFSFIIHFVTLFSVCFTILQKHNKLLSIMLLHVS